MAKYDFRCDACEEDVEITSSPSQIYNDWPTCPNCGLSMRRVYVALRTVWKTGGSTQVKKGLPNVR